MLGLPHKGGGMREGRTINYNDNDNDNDKRLGLTVRNFQLNYQFLQLHKGEPVLIGYVQPADCCANVSSTVK